MVTKNNKRAESVATKGRVKVGKLRPNKQAIKELSPSKQKQVKGGFGKLLSEYKPQKEDGSL